MQNFKKKSKKKLIFETKIAYFALFYNFFLQRFAHFKKKQYLCTRFWEKSSMVVLAQLVEHRIVVPSVVGRLGQKL